MSREASGMKLRCRAGDTARVVHSSNASLIDRIVTVVQMHEDGRWECELIGRSVLGCADDGEGLILTRDWLFSDAYLEPRLDARDATSVPFAEPLLC
ncbi:hypothetical protein CEQ23_22130 [Burkholderia cepacia]|uniref:Uncharacterized protein n=1 Tax=Burkholderia cepacia TaxID=292 RepID=A0ABM6NVM6_BURCE|nr:hypothetical protein DM41_2956 [Burkholderia cepacia ATCC 25416]ASE96028.1 hypothetical protein CEQ23_22130 [Burkholderia cepacia]ATF78969.1 hypothetical protein CO711_17130 [Burkholderia cepacia]QCY03212.1 hypothetical protein EJ998_08815 [Burkholderia cepacia ATCC 25416]SPU85491.1 bacteriophage protein [Burkholderia cepacia]